MNYVNEDHSFTVKKIDKEIVLDGILDDAAWTQADLLSNFSQFAPSSEVPANGKTEVKMLYDKEKLYIAVKCYSVADNFVSATLKRDYGFMNNDNITFLFDTFSDGNNAFVFGMNPYGARREALVSEGGRNRGGFDDSWDNKWNGSSKQYDDHWIAELAIPFKSIRFKQGVSSWRFNCYRNDAQHEEITSWMNIPQNRILMDLTYTSVMHFEEPLSNTSSNTILIPYVSTSVTRDFEDEPNGNADFKYNAGGDAKIALTPSLNLDLTLNPDFSQVEVDRQVTNLDRFEIFFPERRQFFLENADLFGGFGFGRANPFFSRRIGVSTDTLTGNNVQNTIYGGARLNGKLNQNFRLGVLSMQTAKQIENDLPSFNYSVLTGEQRVFKRSAIAFMFVNKQAVDSDDFSGTVDNYDRVAGLEYRLVTADNRWVGKAGFMKAMTPDDKADKFAHVFVLSYIKKAYELTWAHSYIGHGFDAEVGFVPRRDIFTVNPEARLNFFPKNSPIGQINVGVESRITYKIGEEENIYIDKTTLVDRDLEFFTRFDFTNNDRGSISLTRSKVFLLDDFDPSGIQADNVFLDGGLDYNFTFLRMNYNRNRRKLFSYGLNTTIGQFYTGSRFGLGGQVQYNIQPYASISTNFNYNRLDLGNDFEVSNLWLIGPRIDLTFSKEVFLTSFFQYNNQLDNFNINTRFQWRFAPVSDFFLVYTDNYLTDNFSQFSVRNRAVVAKLTYWLGI